MPAQQELLDYITTARNKGFSDEAIRVALLSAGWSKRDITHAFNPHAKEEPPAQAQTIPPVLVGISILLFLLFGGGAAYGLYWYQTQPKPTPSPTPIPISTPTPITTVPNASPSANPIATKSASISSELTFAHNAFGFNVLKNLIKSKSESNVVISPTSIALALSMTYNGASESTKLAMAKTLAITNIPVETLNKESSMLMNTLSNPDPKVTVSIANSIWTKKGISFLPAFLTINKTYYNAQIQSLDFSLSSAADTINTWVSKNTKGKIPTIVTKPIDPTIVMYLINAVYFYGTWTNEFDATLTKSLPFTLSDNTKIQHLFMKQDRKDFLYQETSAFQAVQLPYGKSKQLSMVVILPKTTIAAFSDQLTHATWNSWMKSFTETEGTVMLPKFKIEFETSLKNTLMTLGMTPAFSTETANFSGMRTQKDLFISDVIHKTFIDVDEKGTEAAAVTSVEMGLTSAPATKKTFLMEINKPFFFAITDTDSGEILFMGVVKNPRA